MWKGSKRPSRASILPLSRDSWVWHPQCVCTHAIPVPTKQLIVRWSPTEAQRQYHVLSLSPLFPRNISFVWRPILRRYQTNVPSIVHLLPSSESPNTYSKRNFCQTTIERSTKGLALQAPAGPALFSAYLRDAGVDVSLHLNMCAFKSSITHIGTMFSEVIHD